MLRGAMNRTGMLKTLVALQTASGHVPSEKFAIQSHRGAGLLRGPSRL